MPGGVAGARLTAAPYADQMPRKTLDLNSALDRQDRAIFQILQRDNKTPQRVIAEEVSLSTAAVQRRIAAMEAGGVILTGGISFVLIIVAPHMRDYERLTRRLFAENEVVKSYRTLMALDRVKSDTAIVIP